MRSITAKLICTLVIMALMAGGIYWVATTPRAPQTGNTTTSTTLPRHQHSFAAAWESDAHNHWNACGCGEIINVAAHADADVDGSCDVCGANVPLPPHEHVFGTAWISDGTYHWNVCQCGELSNKASHADADIDEKCDICDAYVLHEHFFAITWDSDETNHWNTCICGEITNVAAHTDADFNEKCDVCDAYVLHEHTFGDTWQSDETSHWKTCGCGETAEIAAHVDDDRNEECDVCDAYVPHEHDFGTAWTTNESGHWQVCDCGERTPIYAHADKNSDYRCDTCAYVVSLPDPPKLYGHSAFIYDCAENDYLFKNQALDKTIYPASITKLFTCYVALQYLKDLSEVITLGKEQTLKYKAGDNGFIWYDSSQVGIDEGDKVSVDFLLHGTLMESGADAAYGLAAAAGYRILGNTNATAREAVDAFILEMNELAKRLGMDNTHFVNPDGYHHADHVVSFQAMVIIAQCAMSSDTIRDICAKTTVTIPYTGASGKIYNNKTLTSTNILLFPNHKTYQDKYYIPQAVGLKTGYTSAAGNCFLGLFIYNGKAVIIGIFGCPTDENRWQDMNALWEYYLTLQSLT